MLLIKSAKIVSIDIETGDFEIVQDPISTATACDPEILVRYSVEHGSAMFSETPSHGAFFLRTRFSIRGILAHMACYTLIYLPRPRWECHQTLTQIGSKSRTMTSRHGSEGKFHLALTVPAPAFGIP